LLNNLIIMVTILDKSVTLKYTELILF
jgi:hypothetical protein